MRVSLALLWPLSFGMAVASAVPHYKRQSVDNVTDITPDANDDGEGIRKWNDFSYPVDRSEATIVLRTLEWLIYGLIEPVQDITAESVAQVYVPAAQQGGPMVLVMRSLMIWTDILQVFTKELQATNVWSADTQMAVAEAYLPYSNRAGEFLTLLLNQADTIGFADAARCLMYDRIQNLYMAYRDVAGLIYGGGSGVPFKVQQLITGNFPDAEDLMGFNTPYPLPLPNSPIASYLAQHDLPLPGAMGSFAYNQQNWACADFNDGKFDYIGNLSTRTPTVSPPTTITTPTTISVPTTITTPTTISVPTTVTTPTTITPTITTPTTTPTPTTPTTQGTPIISTRKAVSKGEKDP